MQYFESKRLREERAELQNKAVELRKQELTSETREQLERMVSDLENYDQKIHDAELIERTDALVVSQDKPIKPYVASKQQMVITRQDHADAFSAWALKQGGKEDLIRDRHMEACERVGINPNLSSLSIKLHQDAPENLVDLKRAESLTTPENTENGAMVQGIEKAMLSFGSLRNAARIVRTANANPWRIVTHDATAMLSTARAKTEEGGKVTPAFGMLELKAFSYGTECYPIANETLEDSALSILPIISEDIGEAHARKQNKLCTTGVGTTEPKGIITGFNPGVVWAAGDVDWYSVLVQLQDALEDGYQGGPSCGFMFNKKLKTQLRLMIDTTGRPLWQSSLTVGAPDTICGAPYWINNDMPDYDDADNGHSILYGDFSKFVIREVGSVQLTVLRERFAELNAIGLVSFARYDSAWINTQAVIGGVTSGSGSSASYA